MLNWKETPHFRDNFTKYKKKSLLNLAKVLQYKVSQTFATLLQYKICRAKFKVWPLIKISLYTATLLQDLFQNFGLIKFDLAKVLQYKVTLIKVINTLQANSLHYFISSIKVIV